MFLPNMVIEHPHPGLARNNLVRLSRKQFAPDLQNNYLDYIRFVLLTPVKEQNDQNLQVNNR